MGAYAVAQRVSKLTAGISPVLHNRHAMQLGADAKSVFNIQIEGVEGPSGDIGGLIANISQSTPQLVMQWLSSVQCAGVKIQPRDIAVLLGKDPHSLQLYQAVQNGNFTQELELVPTTEIMSTLRRLQFESCAQPDDEVLSQLKHGYETPEQRTSRMVREMELVGIKVPGAVDVDWAQTRNTAAQAEIQKAQDVWNAEHGFAPTPAEPAPHPRDAFGMLEE